MPNLDFSVGWFGRKLPCSEGDERNFVEKALELMNGGYAAIIIQNSAGSGKAREINRRILERNTLIASIKMPIDLFIGKSSVQTNIYVFKVGEAHNPKHIVKFIDFSEDGYTRTNRKKATINLRDTNNAKGRYEELVNLVLYGRQYLKIFSDQEYYEGVIDPKHGGDWNQSAPIDTRPTLADFKKTVADYLSWEVSNLLRNSGRDELGKYRLGDLFEKIKIKTPKYKTSELPDTPTNQYNLPALTAGIQNQGLNNYVPSEGATILKNVISISANGANTGATFFQSKEFTVLQDAYAIRWLGEEQLTNNMYLFLTSSISQAIYGSYEWTNKAGWERIKNDLIHLPISKGSIDFAFMERFIAELNAFLSITGLKDYSLTPTEQQALEEKLQWKSYKLGDLFEKIKIKTPKYKTSELPSVPTGEYTLPALTAGIQNQGLNNYVPRKEATILKEVISISANGANTGATFYQSKEFTILQDSYAIRWCGEEKLTENMYLFLTATISRAIYGNYEWTNKAGWERIKNDLIYLPISKDSIDFAYMETLISAIQKLVIRDVVDFADREIKATEKVIGGKS